ncbi:uncharacterized protein LOC105662227 [Megachile rotundata]|uniref:uncharacterized protein LOC105662227 n=1 Tax=Megachile rotundata TaxID=143995 RepID=UPI00061531CA|nr:PREDICTED: uncharacterized protein LOC105662227 [Megachile rotundata]XP_012138621.1 PREDICTED: uncharacterized protein LOC105662227 [Megachile rotundata]XP_012138622.1 PREDICTED: uncharacterized protein LOC105662227 [Megachile rotundata]XP_012138624.1 PREDICTED: uncharacterized protein LOC105662227 [Megachile rotundata]XP_012138625.1 PREDICTED: uncharacterized protein LOC105662227 [Megachile rotundata]
MLTPSQRRRHPSWRMLFTVVILTDLVRHCEPISIKRFLDSSSSSTSSRTSSESGSQNLGSPSDIAWQAWLLLDSQNGAHSSLDSATFLRRITPKSVFIAPELPLLPPCAEGYRADAMGRCVKSVNINPQAHLSFLLERLNDRYGNRGSSSQSSFSNPKKSSERFQLDIPREETRSSFRFPIIVPPEEKIDLNVEEPAVTYETATTTTTTTTTPATTTLATTTLDTTTTETTTSETITSETTTETTSNETTTYEDDTTYETTIYDATTYETTIYDTTSYENSTEMERDETSPENSNATTIQNDV